MIRDAKPRDAAASGSEGSQPASSLLAHLGPPKTEKERIARERIEANYHDAEAWEIFANEAQARPIAQASAMFDQILSAFPSAGKFWNMYAEAQISANNDEGAKFIFSRCLLTCLHIDLWRTYIRFIRRVNEQRGPEGLEEIRKAYEFLTTHVGMDLAAGPLWQEYISFLKVIPVASTQEETHRMLVVRKAYQQAVQAPINHVEQLWKDYESYENSISRALAKGLLAELQPKFHSARAVYRERKKLWELIEHNYLPVPPTGSSKEEQQCAVWKQLLAYEMRNPQRLDPPLLARRVIYTYEQCLMCFYHYPDIWYEYATWFAQNGSNESGVSVFWRGLKALPDATFLYYAYAEFEEARGCIQEARKVYDSLVNNEKVANSLAYIQLLRFIRRTEGIEPARKFFLEVRRNPSCTYHFYLATAKLAFCVDKDPKKARDILELGLSDYLNEPSYVLEYADFLCRLNDDRNVRALFERALNVLSPEESVEIWNQFVAFEQTYGDIASMLKVAQRRREALAGEAGSPSLISEGSLQELISRYRFLDLWPCSPNELNHLAQQQTMLQKMAEKQPAVVAKKPAGPGTNASKTFVRPDISQMAFYGAQQGRQTKDSKSLLSIEEAMKILPAAVGTFFRQLPPVEGPYPDPDMVLSIFLKKDIPNPGVAAGGSNGRTCAASIKKRKDLEKEEEEPALAPATAGAPTDVFRLRQLQRSRASAAASKKPQQPQSSSQQSSQQPSTSGGGSAFSGDARSMSSE